MINVSRETIQKTPFLKASTVIYYLYAKGGSINNESYDCDCKSKRRCR